jgi:hypothetical protein
LYGRCGAEFTRTALPAISRILEWSDIFAASRRAAWLSAVRQRTHAVCIRRPGLLHCVSWQGGTDDFQESKMVAALQFSRFEEASGYCGKCLRQTPVGRQGINHLPHLILTLLTGLWAIVWIYDARRTREWRCLDCGSTVYRIMSNPLEKKRKWR